MLHIKLSQMKFYDYKFWIWRRVDIAYCQILSNYFNITKTSLYNFDLLKPHFFMVELGFTGVYIIFLISAQKHRLWYSLEPPRRGGSNEYPQSMFWAEIWKKKKKKKKKKIEFLSVYLNWRVFVMKNKVLLKTVYSTVLAKNRFSKATLEYVRQIKLLYLLAWPI